MDFSDRIKRGVQTAPMRNVFYGVEGFGKSTLASLFPSPLTLAAEDGVGHIDTNSLSPADWYETLAILQWLYEDPNHGFQTLNLDTIGWIEEQAAKYLMKQGGVETLEDYGGGFGKWKRALFEQFDLVLKWSAALYGKGMHINLIGHVEVKRYQNPTGEDYDRFVIAAKSRDTAERCKQWADNVFFLNFDTITSEAKGFGGTKAKSFGLRQIHAKRSATHDAKTRMGYPDRMEFKDPPQQGFNEFFAHYQEWLKTGAVAATPALATSA